MNRAEETHPTEGRRRTVLSKLRRIRGRLRRLHDPDLLFREAQDTALRAEIARGVAAGLRNTG